MELELVPIWVTLETHVRLTLKPPQTLQHFVLE